ncbi:MAG: hypothetical protein JSV91_04220, partial [Phycisphaerales bacterium]
HGVYEFDVDESDAADAAVVFSGVFPSCRVGAAMGVRNTSASHELTARGERESTTDDTDRFTSMRPD